MTRKKSNNAAINPANANEEFFKKLYEMGRSAGGH